jgi:hypothetical protein
MLLSTVFPVYSQPLRTLSSHSSILMVLNPYTCLHFPFLTYISNKAAILYLIIQRAFPRSMKTFKMLVTILTHMTLLPYKLTMKAISFDKSGQ